MVQYDNNANKKVAYYNYTQTFGDSGSWYKAVLCLGGEETDLCDSSSAYEPLPKPANGGRVGLSIGVGRPHVDRGC